MSILQKTLIQKQLDELILSFLAGKQQVSPPSGWIQAVRLALGMSLRQLGERLGISASAVTNFEKRELAESISLATLKKTAQAMDMELVYYFKPRSGSISANLEKQAQKKAQEILTQSNQTMRLENQETNSLSQVLELERLTKDLLYRMPSQLWD
jgi:predicted DNA-binding mobile mystery protein A